MQGAKSFRTKGKTVTSRRKGGKNHSVEGVIATWRGLGDLLVPILGVLRANTTSLVKKSACLGTARRRNCRERYCCCIAWFGGRTLRRKL